MSSYVTAKWGVHGLVRTLQIEARRTPGIDVSLVSPGGVDTPVYLQAGTYLRRHGRPPPPVDPPEKVARAVVRPSTGPGARCPVGSANHLTVPGFRAFPGVFDRLVTPLMRAGGFPGRRRANSPGQRPRSRSPRVDAPHGRWGRHWMRPVALASVAALAAAGNHARRRRT